VIFSLLCYRNFFITWLLVRLKHGTDGACRTTAMKYNYSTCFLSGGMIMV